jgi:hypothetical protein
MVKFIENYQWVEMPLEAVCRLFQVTDVMSMVAPRVEPITLEDGTVIDKAFADKKLLEIAVQKHLDKAAQAQGYDNIHSASIRAGYVGPFQAEGIKFASWMDSCWAKAYEVLAEVEANSRTIPTAEELVAELPVLA